MYCKKCGKEIPDDSIYCSYCGFVQKEKKLILPFKKPQISEDDIRNFIFKIFHFIKWLWKFLGLKLWLIGAIVFYGGIFLIYIVNRTWDKTEDIYAEWSFCIIAFLIFCSYIYRFYKWLYKK